MPIAQPLPARQSHQRRRHPLSDRLGDRYDTPPEAVRALLTVERLPRRIWEPACGSGNIARVLREAGHEVYATDLNDRGCPNSIAGVDFLMAGAHPACDAITTNPPFALAEKFIEEALRRAPFVVMLLRLAFLESTRRSAILESGTLARVHVFRNRLPMMHRDGWAGPRASSSIAFAWFVFDRNHQGPTELRRISWEAASP